MVYRLYKLLSRCFQHYNVIYRYFLIFSVILRSGYTRQYDFLPDFVLWFGRKFNFFNGRKFGSAPLVLVTLTHVLHGYCLAEYTNGLHAEPRYLPWAQQYVDHFRNVIEPKLPSIMLYTPPVNNDLPSPAKDLPSYRNKRKASTKQDLPSRRTRPRRTTKVPVDTVQQESLMRFRGVKVSLMEFQVYCTCTISLRHKLSVELITYYCM